MVLPLDHCLTLIPDPYAHPSNIVDLLPDKATPLEAGPGHSLSIATSNAQTIRFLRTSLTQTVTQGTYRESEVANVFVRPLLPYMVMA